MDPASRSEYHDWQDYASANAAAVPPCRYLILGHPEPPQPKTMPSLLFIQLSRTLNLKTFQLPAIPSQTDLHHKLSTYKHQLLLSIIHNGSRQAPLEPTLPP